MQGAFSHKYETDKQKTRCYEIRILVLLPVAILPAGRLRARAC